MNKKVKNLLVEAYNSNDVCQEWKDKIKEAAPKLFPEVGLKIGKWHKVYDDRDNTYYGLVCVTKIKKDEAYFYGFDYSFTRERHEWKSSDWYSKLHIYKEATEKEVLEALKKEAKNRGFKAAVCIESKWMNGTAILSGEFLTDETYELCFGDDSMMFTIFKDGQWAEIIEEKEMTLKQIEEELDYKIKLKS